MDAFRHSHEPTDAEVKAGNYPKRKLNFQGLPVSVENEAGTVRRGVDPDGNAWETRMLYPYGYIRGSLGMDGDHVDVFIGPDPDAEFSYVISQKRPPKFDAVDEQKVMLGFSSLGEACHVFLKHYSDSRFLGTVKVMPMADFIAAVRLTVDGDQFIKSFDEAKHPRNENGEFEAVTASHSVDIRTKEQAEAYWKKNFLSTSPHAIKCQYGTRPYHFSVVFRHNHAFTENVTGNYGEAFDHEREFDIDRARAMDAIWLVLRSPSVVTWNDSGKGTKQFDKQLDFVNPRFGRVVLKPTPTTDDISRGVVSSFEFVSWHEPTLAQYDAAKRSAANRRISPTQLKKAQPLDWALPSRTSINLPAGSRAEALPVSEGFAFDWSSSFKGSHNRNSGESDAFLWNDTSMGDGHEFCKALAANEHWITVHPPGHDKGTPLLIQDHPDGTATVIGGAGGKMNHLKLRGLGAGKDYKSTLKEKHAARQEAKKQQVAADKAAGIHGEKVAARKQIAAEVKQGRSDFIHAASELAGWKPEETQFDEAKHSGLSPKALDKARANHEKALFKRANETVDLNRRNLVEDAEARAQSGLGEVPLTSSDPDTLSVADLDPMPEVSGAKLGFDAKYGERSGMSKEEAQAESATVSPSTVKPDTSKAELKAEIASELSDFALKNPDCVMPKPSVLADAQKAAALLKAQKRLKLIEAKARDAQRELDTAPMVESKAHVLEVSDDEIDESAKQQMEDDVRTAGARSFLSALDAEGGEAKVAGHIGTGAFNSLNAAALAIGGDALIDRSVVDVLGISGAAQVLARRIQTDMGADADKVRQAIEEWHVGNADSLQSGAVTKAKELHDAAAAIELPDASNGFELAAAQEANAKRRDAIAAAQKVLGQAHGEMQAGAALVAAMQGKPDNVEVNMGTTKPEQAVIQLRAIGLKPGEYHLEEAGGNLVATVTGTGMDRIAKPIDVEGMAQIRRNLDIMEGKQDEDGWLPLGIANRPDLSMHVEPGVAPRLAQPIDFSGGPEQALKDYIGGRMADGDAMVDILADAQSADFFQKSVNPDGYRAALDAIAPLKGESGKTNPIESLRESWEKLADDFVSSKYGADRQPIHKQSFDVDQTSVDALHRALAETPEGVSAYKPVGDLSPQERNGLRNWWYANVAKEDEGAAEKRASVEAHAKNEPEKSSVDMFGDESTNPDWQAWKTKGDELSAAAKAGSLDWNRYVEMLGSPAAAIETVQDLVRSHVANRFAGAYNTAHPDAALKIGRTTVRNNLNHLDAVDPKARAERQAKEKELIDSLRERTGGKYAAGAVKDKLDAQKEKAAAFEQSQMGFFSTDDAPKSAAMGADERHTIGHAAEQKLAGMMSVVGQKFKPGQPTKLWNPSMSGGKNYARQRLIKLLEQNGRVTASFGPGSGKSLLQLAGFTHLHGKGKVKRGIILAPSVVQGQFGGEATRYLEPGKFKWHAEPGASREERLKAYRDPGTHFVVATHQSFRDDMIHLGAAHAGIPEAEMADRLQKMNPDQRKKWARGVMDAEGMDFGYMATDESQYTVNREGKENSRLANVVDSFADNAPYYMPSSGDIAKNDVSEVYDVLAKMDRKRYGDRDAFMRRYGGDAVSAKEALKREMARYVYSSNIEPDVEADRRTINVPLNDHQKSALAAMNKDVSAARIAHMSGGVAVDEMKRLSPESFAGAPEEKHAEIAKALQANVGLLRNSATKRIINVNDKGAKLDKASELAAERKGKPGVIFAHNLETVEHLRSRLEKEGHRVVTLTGADSSADKDKKRLAFNPEHGEADADIMIASDAGAVGLNLQRGQFLIQMDTSDTAMVHAQRNGRVFRTGQRNNIELIDLVADHPSERKARERLAKKYNLRELITSPMEGLDDTGIAWRVRQAMA